MGIKTIPLSRLEADLQGTLRDCADSGQAWMVELPDRRWVTIQSLDPSEEDSLTSELLESNAAFRALVSKSKLSPRKPFFPKPGSEG